MRIVLSTFVSLLFLFSNASGATVRGDSEHGASPQTLNGHRRHLKSSKGMTSSGKKGAGMGMMGKGIYDDGQKGQCQARFYPRERGAS